jgi:hypothetical protein
MNRPDKVTIDSFSDPNLKTANNNGFFSQFSNQLNTPLLDVKGIQLLRANFVNPSLQLNDFNGQLIFIYSRNTTTAIPSDGSTFQMVRLLPSWYVPVASFTAYTQNAYYNNGAELAAALTAAAAVGGDSITYNPRWLVGDVSFSFDTATRKLSFTGLTAGNYYAPIPADHPALPAFLATYAPTMNALGGVKAQPFNKGVTMNSRLGFSMSYFNRGFQWSGSSIQGCATTTGVPQPNAIATEGDSWPILLGTQNINVYLSVITGSGYDSRIGKNLLASLPVENASLGVCSYTLSSVEKPAKSVASEIYTLQINLTDDVGNPLYFYNNMNFQMELNIYY